MRAKPLEIPEGAEWVTLQQAAYHLQLDWSTVRRMCEDGTFEARRFGRFWRIRRRSLDALTDEAA